MPIRHRVKKTLPPKASELTRTLMEEWRDPKESGQPLIIIEGYLNEPTHVYVIWDQWRGMNQAERSEIIMDALEGLDGEHRIQNLDLVTVAMGLTAEEARRMGIEPG